jgi:DNA invertase Pin-like site-specific DNA recombinase
MSDSAPRASVSVRYQARERGKEISMTSAVSSSELRVSTAIMGRSYGYVRASTIKEVENPEVQAEFISRYCQQIGRRLDEVFSDDALSGGLPLAKREGGRKLLLNLRKGDHLVVARTDRMFRSLADLSRNLGEWAKLGVVVHLCDLPVGPIDPGSIPYRLGSA